MNENNNIKEILSSSKEKPDLLLKPDGTKIFEETADSEQDIEQEKNKKNIILYILKKLKIKK